MKKLTLYNTFTQKKEIFEPLIPDEISLYVCGITVYDDCHLGHARVFVAFDVIVRFLRATGWKVKYVRNITDIDDKIIKRAQENNESIEALTGRFIKRMEEDAKALNVLSPDMAPRATFHMDNMIAMIATLEEKGFAYVSSEGDVYFQVDRFPHYGELAHKDLASLQGGARVEVVAGKRSPLDFVLWKKAKAGEPYWPSPWGEGRPGWHIECSAMSIASLGTPFDMHGGGADLIFPHHENERAQSECATDKPFARWWLHVGFVQINKEKMAKSLNNFLTVKEILTQYHPEVVRYFLIASHYRSPVQFSSDQLENAKQALNRLYVALRGITVVDKEDFESHPLYQRFIEAMNDDFNTPVALSVLFEVAHESQRQKEEEKGVLAGLLKKMGNILGLLVYSPDAYLQGEEEESAAIKALILQREEARRSKNWALADEIRDTLIQQGIVLEDTPQGTLWRKSS